MTVRREIAQPRRETGARRREGGRRIGDPLLCPMQRVNNTVTDRAASPPACPRVLQQAGLSQQRIPGTRCSARMQRVNSRSAHE